MYSFTKKKSKNKSINPNKLILNQKKSSLSLNNQNIINKTVSFSKNKNKSRNNETKLLLLYDSNSDKKQNLKKNYNNTTYNKKYIQNVDVYFNNMQNKNQKKIKKIFIKKN